MTDHTHSTKADYHGIPVTVYPEEFFPLLKIINCAILMPERFALTDKELETIIEFQDKFADIAYEYGVN